jgi:ABC-2 type transport system ATP-binding protein
MIKVKDIIKKFPPDKLALDNISFEVLPGEICGYIGTNGAGKSTTVKILTSTIQPDSGVAEVCGLDVLKNQTEVKSIVGYVPETGNLFNPLSPVEFLDFSAKIRGLEKSVSIKRIEYFSSLFDFSEFLDKPIGTLSKGNKQKVLITAALIHNPEVIILDEPLNGLDANSIFIFQDMITKFSLKGKTIIYCSHLLKTIEEISTKIIILESGRILFDKKSSELKKNKDFSSLENLFMELSSDSNRKTFEYAEAFG